MKEFIPGQKEDKGGVQLELELEEEDYSHLVPVLDSNPDFEKDIKKSPKPEEPKEPKEPKEPNSGNKI